jgi:hypothetical protein
MVASPVFHRTAARKIDDLNDHNAALFQPVKFCCVEAESASGEKRQVRTAGWLTVNDGQSC